MKYNILKDRILEPNLTELILKYSDAAGAGVTSDQAELFRRHIELMLDWNRRINLTRITDPDEIVVKHLLDSILPAPALPRSGLALDVGSGAGFPGIPLKIFRPDLEVVLLDSSRKKISFLTAAIAALGLKGAKAIHGRWEDFAAAGANQGHFQLITMRAVRLEPEHITILAAKVLKPGGLFAWWSGPESGPAPSVPAASTHVTSCPEFPYVLPGIEKTRSVRLWNKLS